MLQARHRLRWPADAHFQIAHRGQVLWAPSRADTLLLREFVASTERVASQLWLQHIPTHFLTQKARAHVVASLDRLLAR